MFCPNYHKVDIKHVTSKTQKKKTYGVSSAIEEVKFACEVERQEAEAGK